jgi:alpha-L-rhamnosidase
MMKNTKQPNPRRQNGLFRGALKSGTLFLAAILMTTSSGLAKNAWRASWIGATEQPAANETSQQTHEVVVTKALYGVKGHPAKQVDVTKQIQQAVAAGKYRVTANNGTAGRDPAFGHVKTLELECIVDGKVIKISVKEDAHYDLVKGVQQESQPKGVNQWSCFRKIVHLDQAPRHAMARIAADSKYWLWINGECVVFEGQLKRGPTPNDTYFDRVDLTKYLQQGDNTIAVLLWYFGKHGFSHQSSGQAGLVFDAEVDGKPLLSDRGWKAVIHPAYGNTGAPHPNYRLPESNIRFDAQSELLGWKNPNFDDSNWAAAAEFGRAPCAPWNALIERPIPLWKDFGLKDYVNAADLPKVSDGKVIKAKLPYNAQITPYLKVEGPAGELIDIRMDNYNGGGPPNVRAEYVTRAGSQDYENLGWMNGHEVHYTIPVGFKILSLMYRETGYNAEFTGTFECDDDFLNRYRQKALRTLYVTMRDTYFDCPDRERAQWWGDLVNEMGEAFYALDARSNHLAKKGILELANWQRSNDTIFSPVPAGNWSRELPMQMLNSVGYFGFWTYYQYTGDLETIRAVYPAVKRYLSLWKLGADGLVVPRKGDWLWGDWGQHKDMTILFNGWYYLALKGQLNMAQAVGEVGDVSGIEARMQSIEQNFNQTFWNGKEYRSPGYNGQTDDRVHALAVISGLAKPEQYDAIRQVFKTQEHSSPYMEKYVGEALYQMRLEHDAIARTKKRFKEMTDHPYTTLWEDWRIGGSGGGTINHAWCGGALTLLSQYGAGVAPVTPGYGTYHVLPQMGPLKYIKTTVPSVKGNIDLELQSEADVFSLKLNSPVGTTAIVGIPKRPGSNVASITANGGTIWKDGKPKVRPGLDFLEETEHYIKFSVQPGRWTLESELSQ